MQMTQKLIYKNESIKKFKSGFKKDQIRRVYTSFGITETLNIKAGRIAHGKPTELVI